MTIRKMTILHAIGLRKPDAAVRPCRALVWMMMMGALLLFSTHPAMSADSDLAGRFIESANKAMAAGKLKEAEEYLDRAAAVAPQDERVNRARERFTAQKQAGEQAEAGKQRAIERALASHFVEFPSAFRSRLPQSSDVRWDKFSDDNFVWAPDKKRGAFRRCSGDIDKPTCLLMVFELSNLRPAFVTTSFASPKYPFAGQTPVFFGKDFIISNDYYAATLVHHYISHDSVMLLATDTWNATASPDGKLIAYCTSFQTGEDLWIVSSDGAYRKPQRLTSFAESGKTCNTGDCCNQIKWSKDGRRINFRHKGEDFSVSTHSTEQER